ncbi:hypothetical protein PhCBS80983_g06238 [Powellomyces hirtus]|uniref:Uncharacterized protein n=1 Tax=Powellomyces hirtus TaxID=109895 RepID=A0A507DPR7_9FUNG|nr:hypothetical protein PhCBS80983_g06238 [Powellomyces hirtus]
MAAIHDHPEDHSCRASVSETSPLLGENVPADSPDRHNSNNGNDDDDDDLTRASSTKRWAAPSRHTVAFGVLAVILISLTVTLPIVYLVVIPHRLCKALSGSSPQLQEAHLIAINNDSITLRVRALAHNDDIPPVQVTMQPTLFALMTVNPHNRNPLTVGSLQFPGLVIPRGTVDVPIDFTSDVKHLNVPFITSFVKGLMGKQTPTTALPPQRFWMQASPMMSLHNIGAWVVPMENTMVFDKDAISAPDASNMNITVVAKELTPVSALQFKLFANMSFDNPLPVSFAAQHISVLFSVFYDGTRIVDMTIPPTTHLVLGHNTNATIAGLTHPDGLPKLMHLVGEYAAGNASVVQIKNVRLRYEKKREKLPWIETIIRDIDFEVHVPGASEEDDDGALVVVPFWIQPLTSLLPAAHRARKVIKNAHRLARRAGFVV